MFLAQLLQPKNNSLNSFRILAALLVIYGHAPAFFPDQHANDLVFYWLGFDYSGSLAVKFFFMLSGLLVANSLFERPQIIPFLFRRAVRIFPGLLVCIFISAFALGLIMTNLQAKEYLLHPQTWRYWLHNSLLIDLQWQLPGVFTEAKTPTVNGSLWTLPLEVLCYLCLAIFFVSVLQRQPKTASLLLLAIICCIFLSGPLWPNELARFKESLLLGGCFCIGVFVSVYQHQLLLNLKGVLSGLLVVCLLWFTSLQQLAFYCLFFYICLYLSGTTLVTRFLKFPGDPSYGIYIYGFLIQQCLANIFPMQGIFVNQISAAIIATVVGYLSWYLIEKPAMESVKKKLH